MNFIISWFLFFFEYLLSLIIIVYAGQLIHELGKVSFAKLSGYHFNSLNFTWFTINKINGKIKFTAQSTFLDTSSNLAPKQFTNKMRFRPYLYGGVIFDLICLCLSIIILLFTGKHGVLFRVNNLICIAIFFYNFLNIIPINLFGNPTDFKIISYIKKSHAALYGYYTSLKSEELSINQVMITEYPNELFEQARDVDHRNPFVMYQDWLKASYYQQMIFKYNANFDLITYVKALLPFLNFVPKIYKAQYLNEAIFTYLVANYETKWALDHWDSRLINRYSTKQNYPAFIKTTIMIELMGKDKKYLKQDLHDGNKILSQAHDQINDLYIIQNIEKEHFRWREVLNFNRRS